MQNKIPEIKNIKFKKISSIKKKISKNGIKTYILNNENTDIVKISVVFNVGIDNENKFLLANFATAMQKEASVGKSADEIAEIFDFYGSSIESTLSFNLSEFQLNTTSNFIHEIFPYFAEIIINPSFPEKEFQIAKTKYIEKLKLFSQKTNYVAGTRLNSIIFGNNNSRGHITTQEDIENLKLEDIKNFAKKHFIAKNAKIFIYGNLDDKIINFILSFFENKNKNWNNKEKRNRKNKINICQAKRIDTKIDSKEQSSLNMALLFPKMSEDDLIDLSIINTILGGYFGSRLMTNIREKKGYTYGINSFILEYDDCVVLKIISDLGKNYIEKTIEEIKKEIIKLQKTLVAKNELECLKNYLLGDLISAIDGSYNQFYTWKSLILKKQKNTCIEKTFKRIECINAEEIRLLANKFLTINNLFISVAG